MSLSLENFIGSAVSNILDDVHDLESFILILTPPGSSRGEIVRRLANELKNVEFLVYEDLHKRLGTEDSRFKPLRGLFIEGKDILEYIKDDYGSIKEAFSSRRVVIVPRSTMDAVVLVRRLREELGRDWGSAKKYVVIDHLSSVFERELDKSRVGYPDYIKTDHKLLRKDDVVKDIVDNNEGISLALWNREAELSGKPEDGVKAIMALSPGTTGFDELAREYMSELKVIIPTALVTSAANAAGLMVLVPDIHALVVAGGLTGVSMAIGQFLDQFTARVGINAVTESLKRFSERFLRWLTDRDDAKNKFVKSMGQLLNAVVMARDYVVDDRFEGIVDEVASDWGLDVDTFRNFVDNVYKVATQRLVTEDELNKRLAELEKKFEELSRDVEKVESELESIQVLTGAYRDPSKLGIDLDRGVLRVEGVEYALVVDENFEKYSREIMDRIVRGGFVVLTGSKGIGKSVLSKYSLAKLLRSRDGPYVVYEVEKINGVRDVERLHRIADNAFGEIPTIYYDPSVPEHYEPGQNLTPEIRVATTVKQLLRFYQRRFDSKMQVPVVVVLPSDMFQLVMSSGILESYEAEFMKEHVVNIDLRTSQFLSGVIKSYSGGICDEEVYERLGREAYERYREGYTLVARYVGEWLKVNNCSVKDVEQAIRAGAGVAKAFIAQYIFKAILGGDDENIESFKEKFKKYALAFAARALLGPMPPKWLVGRVPAPVDREGKSEIIFDEDISSIFPDNIGRWLSMKHEDLIEDTMKEIVDEKLSEELKKYEGIGKYGRIINAIRTMEKLVKWALNNLPKTKDSSNIEESNVEEAVADTLSTTVVNRLLREEGQVLRAYPHELARLVGVAHTIYPVEPLLKLNKGEWVEKLRDWILVGDEIPPSARLLLQKKASLFRGFIDPCGMVNELYREVKASGRGFFESAFEGLGLLAITGGEFGKECLDMINTVIASFMQGIEVTVIPLSGLKELARRSIETGEYDEVARLLYIIALKNPKAAEDILRNVVLLNPQIFYTGLSWAGKLIFTEALKNLPENDDWTEFASYIIDHDICKDDDFHGVRCLYAKARLYPYIATFESSLGERNEANRYIDEAMKAIEELSRRSRDELVKGLEDTLRLRGLFQVGETINEEMKELRAILYHHAALVKTDIDLGTAFSYANQACSIAKDIEHMNAITECCGLRARLNFLMGNIENAVKEFKELWKEALLKALTNMDRESVVLTVANYLVSLLAENDLNKVKEEYRIYHPLLINDPKVLASVTGLMTVYGQRVEDFHRVRRELMVKDALIPLSQVLFCLERGIECEEECQSIEDFRHRTLCYDLIEAKDSPKLMKILIISAVEEYHRDFMSQLLEGIDDPREIIEISISRIKTLSSFVEVLKFIIEGRLDKARLIAEYWRDLFRSLGEPVREGSWNELGKSLGGNRCGDDCKMALLKLFYLDA